MWIETDASVIRQDKAGIDLQEIESSTALGHEICPNESIDWREHRTNCTD
jgi:hypothetical protein